MRVSVGSVQGSSSLRLGKDAHSVMPHIKI
jgi:hypothetical protein